MAPIRCTAQAATSCIPAQPELGRSDGVAGRCNMEDLLRARHHGLVQAMSVGQQGARVGNRSIVGQGVIDDPAEQSPGWVPSDSLLWCGDQLVQVSREGECILEALLCFG